MPDNHRLIHLVAVNSITPTQTKAVLRSSQAHFLYHLLDANSIINLPALVLQRMLKAAYCEKGTTTLPYARLVSRICRDAHCEVAGTDYFPRLPKLLDEKAIEKSLGKDHWERRKKRMLDAPADAPAVPVAPDAPMPDMPQPVPHPVPPPAPSTVDPIAYLGVRMDELQADFSEFRGAYMSDFASFRADFSAYRGAYERDISMIARAQMDLFSHLRGGEASVPQYLFDPYAPRDPPAPESPRRHPDDM